MQTFLPYPDPIQCAAVLDNNRLKNQANEGARILESRARVLGLIPKKVNKTGVIGWAHHTATRMWAGFEAARWTRGC